MCFSYRSSASNGLLECASWQMIVEMARSYLTDMQMPCTFWFWAICHATQIANYFPCTVNGILMTSFELVFEWSLTFKCCYSSSWQVTSSIFMMALELMMDLMWNPSKVSLLDNVNGVMGCSFILLTWRKSTGHQTINWMMGDVLGCLSVCMTGLPTFGQSCIQKAHHLCGHVHVACIQWVCVVLSYQSWYSVMWVPFLSVLRMNHHMLHGWLMVQS